MFLLYTCENLLTDGMRAHRRTCPMVSMESTSWTGASFLLYRLAGAFGGLSAASDSAPSAGCSRTNTCSQSWEGKTARLDSLRSMDATRCWDQVRQRLRQKTQQSCLDDNGRVAGHAIFEHPVALRHLPFPRRRRRQLRLEPPPPPLANRRLVRAAVCRKYLQHESKSALALNGWFVHNALLGGG